MMFSVIKIIIALSLILHASSVFRDDEVCRDKGDGVLICFKSKTFIRFISHSSSDKFQLILALQPDTENTIAPYTFKHLTSLRSFEVQGTRDSGNYSETIPTTISVSLWSNSFTGLSKLTSLFLLHVNINFNNENPLSPLESLNLLYFQKINLTEIPTEMLASVPTLSSLTLTLNQISVIRSNSFASLKNLRKLNLDGNRITYIEPGAFDGLVKLEQLDLSENTFAVLPGIFWNMPKLNKLHLTSAFGHNESQLQADIFNDLPALVNLIMVDNKFENIPLGVFEKLTSLKNLDISFNRIGKITPVAFGRLTLHDLQLHDNVIRVIEPDTFNGLSVHRLRLDGNGFVKLKPRAFNGSKVNELNLTSNSMIIDSGAFDESNTIRLIWKWNSTADTREVKLN